MMALLGGANYRPPKAALGAASLVAAPQHCDRLAPFRETNTQLTLRYTTDGFDPRCNLTAPNATSDSYYDARDLADQGQVAVTQSGTYLSR
jgi:hypothetical protein